ncbi:MAG: sugar ABC transporter permease [Spirochaetales bacterium]|nr:sugar ABC transporter permease [Spirochaetales bacterium]
MTCKQAPSAFTLSFLAPGLLIFAALTIFPLGFTLYNSFHNLYLLRPNDLDFVGLANYLDALKDPLFYQSLKNTITFMVFSTAAETVLGLLLAVYVHSLGKKTEYLRFLIVLPNLVPPVTIVLIWQNLLGYNGMINRIIATFGFEAVNWFMNPKTAMGALIFIDIWQWTPFAFLLFFAALTSVPVNQYEAAKIDGAGPVSSFFHITIPHIQSTLVMVVLLRLIDSFRLFDKVNILTKGGPANATVTITQFIYQRGVGNLRIGYASALSVCMTLIVLLLGIPAILRNFRKEN